MQNESFAIDMQMYADDNLTVPANLSEFDLQIWKLDRPHLSKSSYSGMTTEVINASSLSISQNYLWDNLPGIHEYQVQLSNSQHQYYSYFFLEIVEVVLPGPQIAITNLVNGSTYGSHQAINYSLYDTQDIIEHSVYVDGEQVLVHYGRFKANVTHKMEGLVEINVKAEKWISIEVRAMNAFHKWNSTKIWVKVDGLAPTGGSLDQTPNAVATYSDFEEEIFEIKAGEDLTLSWSYPDQSDVAYYLIDLGDTTLKTISNAYTFENNGGHNGITIYNYYVRAVDQYGNIDHDAIDIKIRYLSDSNDRSMPILMFPGLVIALLVLGKVKRRME